MNYARIIVFLLIIQLPFQMVAQQKNGKIIVTGKVLSGDSLTPIPFADIIILNRHVGTAADDNGYFSIPVEVNDTLVFSAVGYQIGSFIVPEEFENRNFSIFQIMVTDTVYLRETIVFPWKSYEEFEKEFVTKQLPPTDAERARLNIEVSTLLSKMPLDHMGSDANYKYQSSLYIKNYGYSGNAPPFDVFNAKELTKLINSYKKK